MFCADLHLLQFWLLVVDVLLHHDDFLLLLHQFLDSILVAQLLVVEVAPLLVQQGLEHVHKVQETRRSHVVFTVCISLKLLAQLNRLSVIDFAGRHDALLQQVIKRRIVQLLVSDGVEGLYRPLVEPVQSAAIDERREVSYPVAQGLPGWAHGQDDVQVLLHLLDEEVKHLLWRAIVVKVDVSFFFGVDAHLLRHENLVVRSKEPRDLVLVDQVVHVLEHKTGLKLVVSEQECALFKVTSSKV